METPNLFANVQPDMIPVLHTICEDDGPMKGTEWLVVSIPNGWDDVKHLTKKVLEYKGKLYVFRGWNSDTLKCNFIQSDEVAIVHRRKK